MMDQHPDNPAGNQLPPGVDEAKLLEAVRSSGYPLQSVVAKELNTHFKVTEEWGYKDRTSGEHRTLDVWAWRELLDSGPVKSSLYLLVECKRSNLPFVFFPPGVERMPQDFPEILGGGSFSFSLGSGSHQDASPAAFFGAGELPFVSSSRLAVTFARLESSPKHLKLSGEVPFDQVVMPLASAMEQMRGIFRGATPLIVLAVCVVDGSLIVASGTPETPILTLDPWVRVVHQETIQHNQRWIRRNYGIDFVHRQFLARYVTEHVIPFADALAARMLWLDKHHTKGAATRASNLTWDEFTKG